MRLIGITGGVGAGKTQVLGYIRENYHAQILLADALANELKLPGRSCYQPVIDCLGNEILAEDGTIDRAKMAQEVFSQPQLLEKVNEIIHPAVRAEIMERTSAARESKQYDFFFLEAALLIEEHYDEVVDELWYIYAAEDVRRQRLKQDRGYSEEKITAIMQKQLADTDFRRTCNFVIDNSGSFEETKKQIDSKMEEYPCVRQK